MSLDPDEHRRLQSMRWDKFKKNKVKKKKTKIPEKPEVKLSELQDKVDTLMNVVGSDSRTRLESEIKLKKLMLDAELRRLYDTVEIMKRKQPNILKLAGVPERYKIDESHLTKIEIVERLRIWVK